MSWRGLGSVVAVGALALGLSGCLSAEEKRQRTLRAQAPVAAAPRETPSILRGTIGAECRISGAEPILITGYGIVVGLNGTGSGDAPPPIRAWLERELALKGVGRGSGPLGEVTPRAVIDDRNTSIVMVQARMSPGAPKDATFDVLVTALPGSATTSLEGGRLMTTDLRPGLFVPGGPETRVVATVRGAIFINPFADPARADEQSINRTTGRILRGATVTEPFDLLLTLDSPSHSRARAIVNAINEAFPRSAKDRLDTARGRNDESLTLTIPERYKDSPDEFLQLLIHTRIDRTFPNEWASRYVRAMREEPALAESISWCLQALGTSVAPQIRELYTFSEPLPRLAALRAGARLGDALVTPHLQEIAERGEASLRLEAIELLAGMPPNPRVNVALRELVDAEDITVRIAAYEALAERKDPWIVLSKQLGVERTLYTRADAPGEFRLDVVRSNKPMIYISQQGDPRVVIFGESLEVLRPSLVYAWEDRLMVVGDDPNGPLRVRYQGWRNTSLPVQSEADVNVAKLVEFFAHKPTPESPAPGLAMTYSEVVGALYELTERGGAIPADFVAEQDRLQAQLLAMVETEFGSERPELAGDEEVLPERAPPSRTIADDMPAQPGEDEAQPGPAVPVRRGFVVPIAPRDPKDPKKPD